MRRIIAFIILVAGTFYLALIYNSNGLVFLGYAEIALMVLLLIYNINSVLHLHISLEAPFGITEKQKRVPIKIEIKNYSRFPTGKISVQLTESYVLFRKKKKTVFYGSAAGREDDDYSVAVIHAEWKPGYTGKAVIKVGKVRCFDLLGLLALPLQKKKVKGSETIMILPAIYNVPVETGHMVSDFAEEQERYLQSGTEETSTEHFQIRSYQPGDRIRSIHWKLSAKENELMVRDYQPVRGCPALLFLNLTSGGRQKETKKEAKKKEYFFSAAASLSKSMAHSGCTHYVIWYDGLEKDVMRYRMEEEEDIYELLTRINNIDKLPEGYGLEEGYNEKYREKSYAGKLVLNSRLQLKCNDDRVINYNMHNLEESLAAKVIYL